MGPTLQPQQTGRLSVCPGHPKVQTPRSPRRPTPMTEDDEEEGEDDEQSEEGEEAAEGEAAEGAEGTAPSRGITHQRSALVAGRFLTAFKSQTSQRSSAPALSTTMCTCAGSSLAGSSAKSMASSPAPPRDCSNSLYHFCLVWADGSKGPAKLSVENYTHLDCTHGTTHG